MKTVLVTGFEAFGGDSINPSEGAAHALEGRTIEGHLVHAEILPCVFDGAITALRQAIRRARPSLVVCLGQAGGRSAISVERVAINVDDARIPDNAGAQPIDRAIVPSGPAAYWTTLPAKAIVDELQRAGLPGEVSQTAGTFVCNHVFYGLMRSLARRDGVRGGFVHVPFVPEQTADGTKHPGAPSLPLEDIVRGLEILIATSLTEEGDRRLVGGATH